MRKALIGIVALAIIVGGVGIIGVFVAPRALAALYPVPENPVTFPHQFHVQTLGMECQFCHRAVDESRVATVPALEQCMFCHKAVGLTLPNAQVVRAAWESGEPLDWVRQHRIPDHTQFNHEPHITAGFDCATCHGDVGAVTGQVEQVRTLKMGDCVGCHKQNNAPTQCATCHY
jgi:hypothetical protein